jgi:hypothetical protein
LTVSRANNRCSAFSTGSTRICVIAREKRLPVSQF